MVTVQRIEPKGNERGRGARRSSNMSAQGVLGLGMGMAGTVCRHT